MTSPPQATALGERGRGINETKHKKTDNHNIQKNQNIQNKVLIAIVNEEK